MYGDGKLVTWTTRSIGNGPTRYVSAPKNCEGIPIKETLYGEDYARQAVVVCEGPTDVWAMGPGAVATFGLNVTESQILRLSAYHVRAICFDNQPEAQVRAKVLVQDLSCLPGATYNIRLESGKDPAEADREEIEGIRREFLE